MSEGREERLARVLARLAGTQRDDPSGREPEALLERLFQVETRERSGRPPAERALSPFLTMGEDWLEQRLALGAPLLPDTRQSLLAMLSRRMVRVCLQVLAREHQALELTGRMFGIQPELGASPTAWLERFEQYPVLARVMAKTFTGWREHVGELLGRLEADRTGLAEALFAGRALPALADIEGDAGDTHPGGRSVAVLRFEDGRLLVYKPRDLRATRAVQALFEWLNATGRGPPLHVRSVLPREGYGWEEHIPVAPCRDGEEVERFHLRLGMLLRLMQLLEAGDLNLDNVLAHGEHPVLIDLEVILQPRRLAARGDAAEALLSESVARLGLLSSPFPLVAGVRAENMGALTPPRDIASPLPYPPTYAALTGVVRPRRDGRPLKRFDRHALWRGTEPVDAAEHMDAVREGYRRMHATLREHRDALLAPDGPLAAFSGLPVRHLHRATERYMRAMWSGLAPEPLGSPERWRATVESHLARTEADTEPEVLEVEVATLAAAEVPLFLCLSDEGALRGADGRLVREGFFEGSALDRVRERLLGIDAFPLALHEELLLSTFATSRPTPPPFRPPRTRPPAPHATQWLEHAMEMGDSLVASALPTDEGLCWIGLAYDPFYDCEWIDRLKPELLSGSAGIAVVLSDLYAASAREHFRRTALQALEDTRRAVAQTPRELERAANDRQVLASVGGFLGIGANLYALARCAVSLGVPELADEARTCAGSLPIEGLCSTRELDLVTGAYGLLLALHHVGATSRARDGLKILQGRHEEKEVPPHPPDARIAGALPDAGTARALCLLRLTGETPSSPPLGLTAGVLMARLEFARDSRAREQLHSEVVRYLDVPEDSGPPRLERLDVALEAAREFGDSGLKEHAARLGQEFIHARRESGRWFPEQWAADRHQLSALWGLPALAHAFLRLGAPGRFPSLRVMR